MGFNNIDPEVDTESWGHHEHICWAPVGFNNIDPEVDTESYSANGGEHRGPDCFNNIDPEVDTERSSRPGRPLILRWFQQYRSRSGYWKKYSLVAIRYDQVFQQYRSRSGYWKLNHSLGPPEPSMVSTISIQKWILKVYRRVHRWAGQPVSTISIQKWILKVIPGGVIRVFITSFNNIDPEVDTESYIGRMGACCSYSFNNIDPEVDTESFNIFKRFGEIHIVSTISIQKWILKDSWRPSSPQQLDVSTISIQKWILKAITVFRKAGLLPRFNNIDPEVDTESRDHRRRTEEGKGFQQYRSRSGYWKIQNRKGEYFHRFSFNNIDPEVDTERWGYDWQMAGLSLCFNNIDPEVDTERYWRERSGSGSPSFQQYRSRSGYWKMRTGMQKIEARKGFNNIDPEVDTESSGWAAADTCSAWFQQYRSRSGYWKRHASLRWQAIAGVSTISIQKWILKVLLFLWSFWFHKRFQQYRSRSGYWKTFTTSVEYMRNAFQQYRSRSGYWKLWT